MADKELVIRLDEETYNTVCECHWFGQLYLNTLRKICDAIKGATPLPKGHGKIGDIDKLYQVFERNVACAKAFKDLFDNADTIIEADKGDKE